MVLSIGLFTRGRFQTANYKTARFQTANYRSGRLQIAGIESARCLRLFLGAALLAATLTLGPPARAQVKMPDDTQVLLLIRTALLTLNDALQSGNFTVLRDVAAPGFRDVNTASKLGQIFSNLQSQNIDLSMVAVMQPQLSPKPKLDKKNNTLRITGVFPGKPVGIGFDLIYQVVGGKWRLFGISVNPVKSK